MTRFLAAAALSVAVACASGPVPRTPVTLQLLPPGRPMAELQAALSSPSAGERRAAAWALAGASDVPPEVREALVKMRTTDPEESVRLAAEWALGHQPRDRDAKGASPRPSASGSRPPKIVKQARPIYPPDAFDQKITGTVEIELLIDERGDVAHAEVRQSIPALDVAALETVKRWKFEPAMEDGRPVPAMATAPVTFRIY